MVYQARAVPKGGRKGLAHQGVGCLLQHHKSFEAVQVVAGVDGAVVDLHGWSLEMARDGLHNCLGERLMHGDRWLAR